MGLNFIINLLLQFGMLKKQVFIKKSPIQLNEAFFKQMNKELFQQNQFLR